MSTNITAVDAFTDPVVAPADGDPVVGAAPELMGQALANRTLNNKNRVDALQEYCTAYITGSKGNGVAFDLAVDQNSGSFTVASNQILVPSTGVYEISWTASVAVTDATSDKTISVNIESNAGNLAAMRTVRPGTTNTLHVAMAGGTIVSLTSGNYVSLLSNEISAATIDTLSTARLVVRRIS